MHVTREPARPCQEGSAFGVSTPYLEDDYKPVSLLDYVNTLLRHRYLIAVCIFLAALSAYVTSKLTTPVYEATVQTLVDPGALNSIAGTNVDPAMVQLRNPQDYYSRVVKLTSVVDKVLERNFQENTKLIDLLDLPPNSPVMLRFLARNQLTSCVQITQTGREFSMLSLSVQWSDAQLAADLANAFAEELMSYDRSIKSRSARQKREFIEKQIQSTEKLLREAENNLRDFRMKNQTLVFSGTAATATSSLRAFPDLQLEQDRRDRDVRLQNDLYLTLMKELELARIAENNDATTLSILERATAPMGRIKPTTRTNVLLAVAVGLMLGVGLAFVLEYVAKAEIESASTQEFLGHMNSLVDDLRRLLKILTLGLFFRSAYHEKDPAGN